MLYEQIVGVDPTSSIALSECFEKSTSSTENMEEYLTKFREMLQRLTVHRRQPLKKQPLFKWQDKTSACWKFEEHRILHALHSMLLTDAKQCFDNCEYKKSTKILSRAVAVCKDMLCTDWYKTPSVRSMPELQTPYLLSMLFHTKGTFYYSGHSYKTNKLGIQRAYQLVELSNCLWRASADTNYVNKMKAHYHYTVACKSDTFKDIISHSTAAVRLCEDPIMRQDHEQWVETNNTVHYVTVEEVTCPTIGVEDALRIIYQGV